MSSDAPGGRSSSGGLPAAIRQLGASLLGIIHTRAELLRCEFERERMRVTRLLLLGVGALFFLALGVLTLTIFIIVLFWDSQRLLVIGGLTLLYLLVGGGLAIVARNVAARSARPFATSVAELRKDRERFASRS